MDVQDENGVFSTNEVAEIKLEIKVENDKLDSHVIDGKPSDVLNQIVSFPEESSPDDLNFICLICNRQFKRKVNLLQHQTIHFKKSTSEKQYINIDKPKNKSKKPSAKSKTMLKVNSNLYPFCFLCKKRFKSNQYLFNHMKAFHGQDKKKTYDCSVCNKSLGYKNSLEIHMLKHKGEKLFECDICHQKFVQKGHVSAHMQTHTREKPYECHICKSSFSRPHSLKCHYNFVHGNELKKFKRKAVNENITKSDSRAGYLCLICKLQVRFKTEQALNVHIALEHLNEEQVHKCVTCDKEFKQAHHLAKHMNYHLERKEYKCDVCNKEFFQPDHLRRHIALHADDKPFECNLCDKHYKRKDHLVLHFRSQKHLKLMEKKTSDEKEST